MPEPVERCADARAQGHGDEPPRDLEPERAARGAPAPKLRDQLVLLARAEPEDVDRRLELRVLVGGELESLLGELAQPDIPEPRLVVSLLCALGPLRHEPVLD